ncbi:MAG: DUF3800 domain-containing protein [Oscillospiraceae bacterium]|nr:DUF3800 domain-containing protein [Oscillospiraceae bacterium]
MFADETFKGPANPYFCFAGYIAKRSDYADRLIPEINALKEKHFGNTKVIMHYTEMKSNKGDFSGFKDSATRNKFYTDFVEVLSSFDITIIGVYYDEKLMKSAFGKGGKTNYDIAFRHLLENYLHFLKGVGGIGSICIESRTFNENMYLQSNYFEYINSGSIYYSPDDTKKHLASIGFIAKEDNCVGLQIADILPSRLMRIVNGRRDNYRLDATIKEKIYKNGTDLQPVVGLKKIL